MRLIFVVLLLALLMGCTAPTETKCSGPTVTIATFNIRSFGQAKMANATIAHELSGILSNFDLVAVQEIRDKEGSALPRLAAMANYSHITSPRLGSTSSKEQYAFLYNASRITFENVSYVLNSTGFERPPFVAKFRAGNFTFYAVDIHVKPAKAKTEIPLLLSVVNSTEDYIILGDYNADCSYLDVPLSTLLSGLFVVVPDNADTTVHSTDCAYDRFVITPQTAEDYSNWGLYNFTRTLNLTRQQSLKLSDHYPVWAKFYTVCDTN